MRSLCGGFFLSRRRTYPVANVSAYGSPRNGISESRVREYVDETSKLNSEVCPIRIDLPKGVLTRKMNAPVSNFLRSFELGTHATRTSSEQGAAALAFSFHLDSTGNNDGDRLPRLSYVFQVHVQVPPGDESSIRHCKY